MSQVSYDAIPDYAARTATTMDDILRAFETTSTDLSRANFADEGLDERNLAADTVTDGRDEESYNGGLANAPVAAGFLVINTAYGINIGTGPTLFALDNGGSGWAVGQNVGSLRVVFGGYMRYSWPAGAPAGTLSPTITVLLQYRYDGAAAWTDVPYSDFEYQGALDVWYEPSGAGTYVNVPYWYETMCYEFDIPFPQDGALHTINEVRVALKTDTLIAAAADFQMNDLFFRAERSVKSVT